MSLPVFFEQLLDHIYTGLSYPFVWLEQIFGAFGISFLILFSVIIVACFFVRNFVGIFYK